PGTGERPPREGSAPPSWPQPLQTVSSRGCALAASDLVAGIVLIDASSPIEPSGVFVSTLSCKGRFILVDSGHFIRIERLEVVVAACFWLRGRSGQMLLAVRVFPEIWPRVSLSVPPLRRLQWVKLGGKGT